MINDITPPKEKPISNSGFVKSILNLLSEAEISQEQSNKIMTKLIPLIIERDHLILNHARKQAQEKDDV